MKRRNQLLVTVVLVGSLMSPTAANAAEAAPLPAGLSDISIDQIDALTAEKLSRTKEQLKVDSPLLAAAELAQGRRSAAVPNVMPSVETDESGRTIIEVAGQVDAALLKRVEALGGDVVWADPKESVARIAMAVGDVSALAAEPQITRITSIAAGAITSAGTASTGPRRSERSLAQPGGQLATTRERSRSQAFTGTVTSEGDSTHGAAAARTSFGVRGAGVTVGVLSDGVTGLAASISSGELPPDVDVLPGQAGSGNEGTAMLEIVHDVAPTAKLLFATAFGSAAGFADNIRALRAAGADVIVDDVIYFGESPFQDGPIAQAVIDVTRDGAVYFSSAGNEGNVDDGTSGNYEGDFVPAGVPIGKYAGEAHDFAPGEPIQVVDPVTANSGGVTVVLQWADPLGRAGDDYDLYALDIAGNVVAYSNNVQDGDDDPFEGFVLPRTGKPLRLAVVKFSGGNRYFQLTAFRGRFASDGSVASFATPGVTRGHSAVSAAYSVAAAPAAAPFGRALEPGDPPNPSGPFPNVFTPAQVSERFTSDGPRRVFFTPDGAPLTPGNFSATGGEVRPKPDLTAADGVSTGAAGYSPFFGTSASAPHAAAIAALVLSGRPRMATSTMRAALDAAALDIENTGPDRNTGNGLLMAGEALTAVGAQAQAYPQAAEPRITQSNDGDLFLEPGETGTLDVPITNNGDGKALLVTAELGSGTSGVTISPSNNYYGNIAVGETATRSFSITVPETMQPGTAVTLTTFIRFAGGYSPLTTDSRLLVGQPSSESVQARYTGSPVPIPDNDPAGVSVPLTFSGVGPVSGGVTFSVDGTECNATANSTTVGVSHTYVRDLIGTLTAPDGTAVRLFERTGGSGNNLCQLRLLDSATKPIQGATATDSPYTGDWLPAEPLNSLQGTQADGTWLFTVADVAAADIGTIRSVSMTVQGFAANQPQSAG